MSPEVSGTGPSLYPHAHRPSLGPVPSWLTCKTFCARDRKVVAWQKMAYRCVLFSTYYILKFGMFQPKNLNWCLCLKKKWGRFGPFGPQEQRLANRTMAAPLRRNMYFLDHQGGSLSFCYLAPGQSLVFVTCLALMGMCGL